jgi:ubiquinone/menaquinone biosynthesis C-methylase UbiE
MGNIISILNNDLKKDHNGIYVLAFDMGEDVLLSKKAWEKIYNYDMEDMIRDREDFDKNKLMDHAKYISKYFNFTKESIYLEIGCGPSHIGEYIMKEYGSHFIGIDFNYPMLLILKKYLDFKGYTKYLLIYTDINKMPLKNNSVDFVYGGGVIEHFSDTDHILKEIYRVLKVGGVSFNTVPAFNLWWLTRFYNNIPALPVLKTIFEFIHLKLLKGKILMRYSGYELSFTGSLFRQLHERSNFSEIIITSFAFHPSSYVLSIRFFRELYFKVQKMFYITAIYLGVGIKKA